MISASAAEVVKITTGMLFSVGLSLIPSRTSQPSFLGRFRSSKIKSGRGAGQVDMHLGVFKRFPRQPNIAGTILHHENFDSFRVHSNQFRHFPSSGRAKEKVEPFSGCDSTQILPPSRSTIFLQMANPIPVPSNSPPPCNRWKRTKIRSKY